MSEHTESTSVDVRIVQPPNKSRLLINDTGDDGLTLYFRKRRPNLWFRFWQRLLLGWTWKEELSDE